MTTIIRVAAGCCLASFLAASAWAQSVRVTIPFEFQASGKTLPAGEYRFIVDVGMHSVAITSEQRNHVYAVFATAYSSPAVNERPSVSFRNYGGYYFLHKIGTTGPVVTMPTTREEKLAIRAAKQRSGPQVATVTVPVN